ncbi:hypothetical protein PPTG_21634 [Phytophthora nicotianae INRA-310]|uniref:Uncharacterized protein n=1 Tax=Phytophthora nicotianae (strain INRA-310) TaxID=761204 RepID=W2QVU5_PHYN3|nr:hypothetical protein PPTG_21634 [Phytophthora nicotianae INRA-310]ETN17248.1 hypothetical protein PPTG_21634 [Phytophthora nicotianae INRA-310]
MFIATIHAMLLQSTEPCSQLYCLWHVTLGVYELAETASIRPKIRFQRTADEAPTSGRRTK